MRTDGRTDGRMDLTKLIVSFRNFANAPKNVCVLRGGVGVEGPKRQRLFNRILSIRSVRKAVSPHTPRLD
jgi:hypothetical protein